MQHAAKMKGKTHAQLPSQKLHAVKPVTTKAITKGTSTSMAATTQRTNKAGMKRQLRQVEISDEDEGEESSSSSSSLVSSDEDGGDDDKQHVFATILNLDDTEEDDEGIDSESGIVDESDLESDENAEPTVVDFDDGIDGNATNESEDDDYDDDPLIDNTPINLAEQSDSSEDENTDGRAIKHKNRIGKIPLEWYADEKHVGYNVHGKKIIRKHNPSAIAAILSRDELLNGDKDSKRTIYDAVNDEMVTLTADEWKQLQEIRTGHFAHAGFNPYEDYDKGYFTSQTRHEILGNAQEPKRRFIPSKVEEKIVRRYVAAIKNGWLKTTEQREKELEEDRQKKELPYLMWGADGTLLDRPNAPKTGLHRMPTRIAPTKPALPTHAYSYNPPEEYLMSKEEEEKWLQQDPSDRKLDFIPRKYDALREVPTYKDGVKQNFERCLDLYLCPRYQRKRINIDPESLIPQLPKPSELRPFPTTLALKYIGHTAVVRSVAVNPSGQWLASGAEDGTVRIWEVSTGRCFKTYRFAAHADDIASSTKDTESGDKYNEGVVVEHVAFHPNPSVPLLAVAVGTHIILIQTGLGTDEEEDRLRIMLKVNIDVKSTAQSAQLTGLTERQKRQLNRVQWRIRKEKLGLINGLTVASVTSMTSLEEKEDDDSKANEGESSEEEEDLDLIEENVRLALCIDLGQRVKRVAWHHNGDYFSTITNASSTSSTVLIHRLSTHTSQSPFAKSKGIVTSAQFHPSQPFFFLCTQRIVYVYDLLQQRLLKKCVSGSRYLSSLVVHPTGDHILCGSYDRRVLWFDLDLGSEPYKTLRYHSKAVRSVGIHSSFPLFATASDDGNIHIFHSTVYTDLLTNPLIVPVKILRGHELLQGLGVMDICWHPTQPWVISAGADSNIHLYL